MRLPMLDASGRAVDPIEVSDGLFGVPMNQALVHQVAVSHMANARQGTAATKTRGMVSGGGAKPWRQKHTGRARQGSTRSPQWRGGGVVFGPHPRDYTQRIPKKMNRGAIRCILSQKARDEKLLIVKEIRLAQAKTKDMAKLLSDLGVTSPVLIVTSAPQKDVILSARNLERVKTLPAPQLNALDMLQHDRVVMTEEAVRRAESLWALDLADLAAETQSEAVVTDSADEAPETADAADEAPETPDMADTADEAAETADTVDEASDAADEAPETDDAADEAAETADAADEAPDAEADVESPETVTVTSEEQGGVSP